MTPSQVHSRSRSGQMAERPCPIRICVFRHEPHIYVLQLRNKAFRQIGLSRNQSICCIAMNIAARKSNVCARSREDDLPPAMFLYSMFTHNLRGQHQNLRLCLKDAPWKFLSNDLLTTTAADYFKIISSQNFRYSCHVSYDSCVFAME